MVSRFFLGEEEGVTATTAVASCDVAFSELAFGQQQVGETRMHTGIDFGA